MHVAILVVPRFGAFWASSVHFVLLTTTWLLPQRIIASSTLWRHVQLNSAAPCVWAHTTVHRVRWCALCNLHPRPFWTCAQTAQLSFSAPSLSLTWGVASVWFSRSIMLAELQLSTVRLDTLRLLQLLWRSYLRRHETGHFVWACMSSSGSYCLTCPVIVWQCLTGFDDLGFLPTLSWSRNVAELITTFFWQSGAELTATTGTFRRPSCEDLSANERPLQAWNC